MTTLSQLRRTALSHPGTAERSVRPGVIAFTVNGTAFATKDEDGGVLLRLPEAEATEVLSAQPGAQASGAEVRVPLADIDGQRLNHWVRRAWMAHAPASLAERALAAQRAVPGEVGDLPRGIGGPATRALVNAGITSLDRVAALTEAELKAMHGVGPKAVRVLGEALDASGSGFRRP
ncbi:hypothetical protein GCM10007079_33880 [Nocardiopsis terrae]|uniref:Helix-hairpin-helix domain-containing protein n=1 Tax=Nocardiopsis terrae TaxID=372655 RepID=A0ABR9HJJ6_9ACTN|nr:helix-hairpin-helix domain-containing protein [Nocardiopsis terrae]MBE1459200.1 hypothetical protein [Nocardiopsis terrae]GHC88714.1 hypothetical protein GCM10007079_33880 [Nocardiopsis terrae]